MLLLLLLVYHVFGRDAPRASNPITQHLDSCPDIGYYFRRDRSPNAVELGPCHLCFCQTKDTALCWLREDRRCDAQNYHRHHVGKRETRSRRSPSALSDIFFRDASRDFFNKQLPEQCKPYESSISDGCPPADWCVGCTVCDCDANGRWNCHILSFCNDNEKKKTTKKPKVQRRRAYVRRRPTRPTTPKPEKRLVKKSVPIDKTNQKVVNKPQNRKSKPILRPKKVTANQVKKVSTKPMIRKKNIATRKPINIKGTRVKKSACPDKNGTEKIAKQVVKRVMSVVRKIMANEMKKIDFSKQTGNEKYNNSSKSASIDKKLNRTQNLKATTRKPNKQTRKFGRNKREVTTVEKEVDVTRSLPNENVTVSSVNIVDASTKFPISNVSRLLFNSTNDVENTTNNLYYNYPVNTDDSYITTWEPIHALQNNKMANNEDKTETILNPMITEEINVPPMYNDEKNNIIRAINNFAELNDLKSKNWSKIKLLKEKDKELMKSIVIERIIGNKNLTTNNEFVKINKTQERKSKGKNIQRKIGVAKKNLNKIVNTNRKNQDESRCYSKNPNDNTVNYNINGLQKIFKDLNKNNKIETTPTKVFNILTYLKKFLKKIFNKKKGVNSQNKHHIIDTLCRNIGPCKVNTRKKMLLTSKVRELKSETDKIMTTISIIKGLLYLVEIPVSDKEVNDNNTTIQNATHKDNIQKLNAILRDTYVNECNSTDTQITQINYIKQNTQEFTQTVGKFASTLNEIIAILSHGDRDKRNPRRLIRYAPKSKKNYRDMHLTKLKKLLLKYNLVQNTFIKNMYTFLTDFETKLNEKPVISTVTFQNNKDFIKDPVDNYSRNIINNLRRLKNLVQTLNSSRKKRYIGRDDDSVDYLLMLMEYLIKKNSPLEAAPVNDGIDLLIEAIKNAPDIKPIKKKVLQYTPSAPTISRTRKFLDDSAQKDDKRSNFIKSKENNDDLKFDYTKKDAKSAITIDKEDESTESAYYKKFDDAVTSYKDELMENITEPQSKINRADKADKSFDKLHSGSGGDDSRRYEIYNGDIDDELSLPFTMSTAAGSEDTDTATTSSVLKKSSPSKKVRYYNIENDISSNESVENKTNLNWIDVNYEKEIEEFNKFKENNIIAPLTKVITTTTTTTTTRKRPAEKSIDNASSITNEVEDKKSKSKIDVKDVMFRKQMDLLNSLDYVTEKSEQDESDSKYGVDDKEDAYFL